MKRILTISILVAMTLSGNALAKSTPDYVPPQPAKGVNYKYALSNISGINLDKLSSEDKDTLYKWINSPKMANCANPGWLVACHINVDNKTIHEMTIEGKKGKK